ncbi:hypothetical protein M2319_001101 [Rhodobium gokarnense]|uniref:DUF2269 domain-containing protein n=2 Tax=Rhodobium gokarnense TaxID=364296 RepID=A0ABT3H8W4_9HYPH|nr:hypothetical protein [Rhodobium gokarnense]
MKKKTLKFLHTMASCGMVGALAGHMAVLASGPAETAAEFAAGREIIATLGNYILFPSVGIILVSGLLSFAAHPPFQKARWSIYKLLLGLGVFEGSVALIQTKANYGTKVAAQVVAGTAPLEAYAAGLSKEWALLWALMALCIVNIVLGVWRPRFERRQKAARKEEPKKTETGEEESQPAT